MRGGACAGTIVGVRLLFVGERLLRMRTPDVPVIMITGHASLDSAVEAMKAGAYHYLAKPFRLAEAREVVRGALEMRRIKLENQDLRMRIEQMSRSTLERNSSRPRATA